MEVRLAYFLRTSLLVLLLLGSGCATSTKATVSGPHLVIKERSFDFEEVKEGDTVEHSFRVLNKGDQALEIKKVKPS